jgi:poly(3-hydroxybutyrate) depolymerase
VTTSAGTSSSILGISQLGEHPHREFFLGRTPFFAYQADQRFSYCLYVPGSYQPDQLPSRRVLVVVHGTRRTAERFRDFFIPLADSLGWIVMAPLFPAAIGEPNDLNNYKLIKYGRIRFDEVLLGMLDEVRQRYEIATERFCLWGFSGGGQFAHRFLYLHPGRLVGVSVGAPGAVTLVDDSLPWPYGLDGFSSQFGLDLSRDDVAAVPVHLFIGAKDTSPAPMRPAHSGPDGGPAWVSRVVALEALRDSIASLGSSVQLDVVPGVGHSAQACIGVSGEFFGRLT